MKGFFKFLSFFLLLSTCFLFGTVKAVEPINNGNFLTHKSNIPHYNTPILTDKDGSIYVCYITPNLKTVIVKKAYNGGWSPQTVLTATTANDMYHTLCSIGIDKEGFIHAVYNMHNTPWQYRVSEQPYSITRMIFKGQPAGRAGTSIPSQANCVGECFNNWLRNEPNIAAIPGNQITYPVFGYDNEQNLYLTFRECLYCDKSFFARQWSGGIVKYDVNERKWNRVAQGIRPFATDINKLPIGLRLFGDPFGMLHLGFVWCDKYTQLEGGGSCFNHPNFVSYAYSSNHGETWHKSTGETLEIPINHTSTEVASGTEWFTNNNVAGYYNGQVGVTASLSQARKIFLTVHAKNPDGSKGVPARSLVTYQMNEWDVAPQVLAYSPSIIYEDKMYRWVAVSSGLRFAVSENQGQTWTYQVVDRERGPFSIAYDYSYLVATGQLRIYANNVTTGLLAIWTMPYN